MTRDGDGSWAEAHAHLLAQPMSEKLRAWIVSDTPLRPVYGGPEHGPKTRPKLPEPWRALREKPAYAAAPAGVLCLEWLRREYGRGAPRPTVAS